MRKQLDLTQGRAAGYLGVNRVTIARYETNGLIPKTVELACIALELAFYVAEIRSEKAKTTAPRVYPYGKALSFMACCKVGKMLSILKSQSSWDALQTHTSGL